MSNALLEKARAILVHPKQEHPPKMNTIEAGDNKVSMTRLTASTVVPTENAPSHAAPAIQNFEIQPASSTAKAIYWETGTGRILGPAVPEFLARDGNAFWISTTFDGQIRWINADRLRSRKAFEEQAAVREVELIRF